MSFRVGIDIGGTFTDFTILDESGAATLWKQDTDPDFPTRAIRIGLDAVAAEMGMTTEAFLGQVKLVVHGTTIATNTLIQRNGPRIGLLCTHGFRDVLYMRDGYKPERFNVHLPHPAPLVDRYLRLGVRERIDRLGQVVIPLDEDDVRAAAATFRAAGVGAVAVAFLWSITNSAHEQRAASILRGELPGVSILCAADILPEIREWERTSAAVLSAYMLPGISSYLRELEALLTASGYGRGPLIMQVNGGVASVPEILRKPVNVLASGPAAAPAAAAYYGAARGLADIVTIDMGGTSLDVCLVRNGRPAMSRDIQVEQQPIGVPGVEVLSIGAGGGSIAWIDTGGALRVGPRSAGARPGPVAYNAGGTQPTVTDANIMLGYLDPAAFLGGRRHLRADLAEAALARVGARLGLSALEMAAGVIRIVNSNMVGAIRAVSIQRGIDIRGFTLLAGGGAGGLHAVALARELQIAHVLIPREAGTLCAFGMTVTDVRYDESAARHTLSNAADFTTVDGVLSRLETSARARLREEGFAPEAISLERSVDARYPGQVHELTVPVPGTEKLAAADIAVIEQAFHTAHASRFTYSRPELPVEFLHWRVTAVGASSAVPVARPTPSASDGAPCGSRPAYDADAGRIVTMPVFQADDLSPGATLAGPAIIQASTTTVLLGAGDMLSVDADFGLSIAVALRESRRVAA